MCNNPPWCWRLAISRLALVVASVCVAPARVRSAEPTDQPTRIQPRYGGRLRLEYDYRSEGDARDTDLYGTWYGNARDLGDGRIDVYTSGRTQSDLDSASHEDGIYADLSDADGVTDTRLLQAYVDAHDQANRLRLRLGRQYMDVADYLHLDGGQLVVFENGAFGGRAYFGQPVSYYASVSGDLAGGLSLVGSPWTGNRTRVTYAEYYDDSEDLRDHNVLIDLQQQVSDAMRARARLSILNEEFRMAQLDGSYFAPDGDTDVHAGVSRWGRFDARTRVYSPLYNQLGDQEPYTYLYARISHAVTPKWLLSPGASFRFADGSDQAYSNRDYGDYDLTLVFEPDRSLSSSVSLQYWDVSGGDDFLGLTGEVRYRYRRIWDVSVGSAYVDYSYHSYSDISYSINGGQTVFSEEGTVTEETPYSLSYFLRAKWNVTRNLILRMQGEVEDDKAASDVSFRGRGSIEVRF